MSSYSAKTLSPKDNVELQDSHKILMAFADAEADLGIDRPVARNGKMGFR
jgi:hypothetical protein